jgi:hypothetical protein
MATLLTAKHPSPSGLSRGPLVPFARAVAWVLGTSPRMTIFGVAAVLSVTSPALAADGKILASSSEVTDEKHETPQAMIDWIAAYTPKKAKS